MSQHDTARQKELERQRRRLLDLSAANRLLHYRHPKRMAVRIIDELPRVIFDRLSDGRSLTFVPVPEPEPPTQVHDTPPATAVGSATMEAVGHARAARQKLLLQEAERLGINTSYELPDAPKVGASTSRKHQDRQLQTLYFPEELEAQLRHIQGLAQTAIQETGANLLHLVFGFLRWHEKGKENNPRRAPLVLMPVTLKRNPPDPETRIHSYDVAFNEGEAIEPNITLVEKLKQEFSLSLPAFDAKDGLESYFQKVREMLNSAPKTWGLERQVTLALLSFGRLLMWRDLNPEHWPQERPLFSSPQIRLLLEGRQEKEAGVSYTAGRRNEVYDLDDRSLTPKLPPLVVDADSSQHSVLVDVLRGESLVVQGPPGTGKSQTITNLIGAALAAGKTVLFVTQKLAALEVVSRRLAEVGLGDFCLELHSHKTQKQQFMEDLRRRLKRREAMKPVRELSQVNPLHEAAVEKLRGHTDRLHAPYGALQVSPHDILWRVRRLAMELGDAMAVIKNVRVTAAANITREEFEKAKDIMRAFGADLAEVLSVAPTLASHPWEGVTRADLTSADCRALVDEVATWKESASQVEKALVATELLTGARIPRSILAASSFVETVRALPHPPKGSPRLFSLLLKDSHRARLHTLLNAIESAQRAWARVPQGWQSGPEPSASKMRHAEEFLDRCSRLFSPDLPLSELSRVRESAHQAIISVERASQFMAALASPLGVKLEPTPAILQALAQVLDAAARVDEAVLAWRDERLVRREAEETLRAGAETCAQLKKAAQALNERFNPNLVPPFATLKTHAAAVASAPFIPWISGAYRAARRDFKAMAPNSKANKATLITAYNELLTHHAERERFRADVHLQELLGQRFTGLDTRFDRVLLLLDWWRAVETAVSPLGSSGQVLTHAAWKLPPARWREVLDMAKLRSDEWSMARQVSNAVQQAAISARLRQAQWVFEPVQRVLSGLKALIQHIDEIRTLAEQGRVASEVRLEELQVQVRAAREACEATDALEAHQEAIALLGPDYQGWRTPTQGPRSIMMHVETILGSALPKEVTRWLLEDVSQRHTDLRNAVRELERRIYAYTIAASQVRSRGQMAPGAWEDAHAEAPLTRTQERLLQALERSSTLASWASYLRRRQEVAQYKITTPLLEGSDSGRIPPSRLAEAFEAAFFQSLAAALLQDLPELDNFSGAGQSLLRERFAELDRDIIQLQGAHLAYHLAQREPPPGVQGQKVAELTELRLIKHELDKKQRHIPIRELVRRAGAALQTLMPCFMMGPQSVAQYLPPGKLQFDLVVMDEASQLRPEDALGAIARGGQLVVVGDPEQLPPTSFFDLSEQEDELEEMEGTTQTDSPKEAKGPSLLDESESILVAAARLYPMRMLRWHYRSRHPGLIAFSNREFYNGDLIVFPAPGQYLDGLGVHFEQVADGLYEATRNEPEARAVVEAVRQHARVRPHQSLIVVTLNIKQRDLITDLLSAAEKEDESLAQFLAQWAEGPEPVEVKNLENVQGDERDVVLVSVTFGPNRDGRFLQNFGPINQSDGYRRLNVLFTRARCALTVFASFDPSQMRVDTGSPRGMRILQAYLYEAQGRQVAQGVGSGRGPDSDFEVAVERALSAHGLEVVPQVGVAGYFIDLAIRHPKHPGRYILGVECDGDRYHRAKSARDRDRLRDNVLKGLGWKLHRVWSTDWFQDPVGQAQRVVTQVRSILAEEGKAVS